MLAEHSWLEIICWIVGLLAVYEIIVYVYCTYGKKLLSKDKQGFVLEDSTAEETTESRIARIDEQDEASYESNECYFIDDEKFDVEVANKTVEEFATSTVKDVEVARDGMYHSVMPDVNDEEDVFGIKDDEDLVFESETESFSEDHDRYEVEDDEDNGIIFTDAPVKSPEDDLEVNYNRAEEEQSMFYTEEEIEQMNFGLFKKENVETEGYSQEGTVSKSGDMPNLPPVLIKTDNQSGILTKNDFNFEEELPIDIETELAEARALAKAFTEKLRADRARQNSERTVVAEEEEDDTPIQEEP